MIVCGVKKIKQAKKPYISVRLTLIFSSPVPSHAGQDLDSLSSPVPLHPLQGRPVQPSASARAERHSDKNNGSLVYIDSKRAAATFSASLYFRASAV